MQELTELGRRFLYVNKKKKELLEGSVVDAFALGKCDMLEAERAVKKLDGTKFCCYFSYCEDCFDFP